MYASCAICEVHLYWPLDFYCAKPLHHARCFNLGKSNSHVTNHISINTQLSQSYLPSPTN